MYLCICMSIHSRATRNTSDDKGEPKDAGFESRSFLARLALGRSARIHSEATAVVSPPVAAVTAAALAMIMSCTKLSTISHCAKLPT